MAEAADGVEKDLRVLVEALNRLGEPKDDGSKECAFLSLFADELVEQQLESLMGSLRAAKKRGIVSFEGQILLQGVNDKSIITLAAAHVTSA